MCYFSPPYGHYCSLLPATPWLCNFILLELHLWILFPQSWSVVLDLRWKSPSNGSLLAFVFVKQTRWKTLSTTAPYSYLFHISTRVIGAAVIPHRLTVSLYVLCIIRTYTYAWFFSRHHGPCWYFVFDWLYVLIAALIHFDCIPQSNVYVCVCMCLCVSPMCVYTHSSFPG